MVASVLTLARGLDIATTAEGVETEEQCEMLQAAGVNLAQGWLFGRPCPVAELDFVPPSAAEAGDQRRMTDTQRNPRRNAAAARRERSEK